MGQPDNKLGQSFIPARGAIEPIQRRDRSPVFPSPSPKPTDPRRVAYAMGRL